MTKADLVQEISKQTGIDRNEVLMIVEAFMETVKGSLSNGKDVYLRGFGSFIIKRKAEKQDEISDRTQLWLSLLIMSRLSSHLKSFQKSYVKVLSQRTT